jgi:acyl-CoA thioesterase-1
MSNNPNSSFVYSSNYYSLIFVFISLFFSTFFVGGCKNNENQTKTQDKTGGEKENAVVPPRIKTIVFFGNSLTAGYGLEPAQAFPALIQKKIDSLKLPYKVVNAGVSGETSSGGSTRIDWILKQPVDVFVLELGANDGLRGLPLDQTKMNLQSIIDKVKKRYPEARLVLAGMQIPPNMGAEYTKGFQRMFPELARENNMTLIPFLLQGVGGEAKLNQQDGIHPTADGAKIVAENVWEELHSVLQ